LSYGDIVALKLAGSYTAKRALVKQLPPDG